MVSKLMRRILPGVLAVCLSAGCMTVFGKWVSTDAVIAYAAGDVDINEDNFPDKNFRQYVLDYIDEDKNGLLDSKECSRVTHLDVSVRSIESLKGVEYFTSLVFLQCSSNRISSLDVSKNTVLKELRCNNNRLSSLDMSNNTGLTLLQCNDNQLRSLDVSKNTALTQLTCRNNRLSSLDVSNNTSLTFLNCVINQLSSLDVSNNTFLTSLNCEQNQLRNLDVSNNTALTYLGTYNNQLSSLDVSNCTELTRLSSGYNQLTELDVSNNIQLFDLECTNNQLTALDVSNNTALIEVRAKNNKFGICAEKLLTDLPGFNPAKATNWQGAEYDAASGMLQNITEKTVKYVYDCGNGFTETFTLNLHSFTDTDVDGTCDTCGMKMETVLINETTFPDEIFRNYIATTVDKNGNGRLDAEEIAGTKAIKVADLGIQSLQGIEYFTGITYLACHNNKLTGLDLSKNVNLTFLNCGFNQLTELDVSKNTKLIYLACYYNQLEELDVSKNTALTEVSCGANRLETLDVSHNTALITLKCSKNRLTGLDLSENKALTGLVAGSNKLSMCMDKKLTELPGFDPVKATNWKGAGYDATNGTLQNITATTVSYTYDCGNGKKVTFTLDVHSYTDMDEDRSCDYCGIQTEYVPITENTFPDEIFRGYIATTVDKDGDGKLSKEEIASVKAIKVAKLGIQSLQGIGYFTGITQLACNDNKLTTLSLKKNVKLTYLACYNNQLNSLDISENINLTFMNCGFNQLPELDVSKNTKLTYLGCYYNQLEELDISKNTALTEVSCGANRLETLDLSQNTALVTLKCSKNPLTGLDVSKNTKLKTIVK